MLDVCRCKNIVWKEAASWKKTKSSEKNVCHALVQSYWEWAVTGQFSERQALFIRNYACGQYRNHLGCLIQKVLHGLFMLIQLVDTFLFIYLFFFFLIVWLFPPVWFSVAQFSLIHFIHTFIILKHCIPIKMFPFNSCWLWNLINHFA